MTPRAVMSIGCLIIAAVSVPMILGRVPPNPLYGFRTRRTLSSPAVWYPANRFSGWALLVAAGASLALLWLLPGTVLARPGALLAVFVGPLGLGVIASFLYLRRIGN
jgi:uncharacterized membrane protein